MTNLAVLKSRKCLNKKPMLKKKFKISSNNFFFNITKYKPQATDPEITAGKKSLFFDQLVVFTG